MPILLLPPNQTPAQIDSRSKPSAEETAMTNSIRRFPIADPAKLPDDMRQLIETTAKKTGFLPNVSLAYAWKPDRFRAFFQFYDALMKGDSRLSRPKREIDRGGGKRGRLLHLLHGRARHHPPILGKKPLLADQVTANYQHADLSPRERAMLDFAVKVTSSPAAIEPPTSRRCAATASRTRRSRTSGRSPPSSTSRPHGQPDGNTAQPRLPHDGPRPVTYPRSSTSTSRAFYRWLNEVHRPNKE